MEINQSHLEMPSIYSYEALFDILEETPCNEKWVLNECGELLSKVEADKRVVEVHNGLINIQLTKAKKKQRSVNSFLAGLPLMPQISS